MDLSPREVLDAPAPPRRRRPWPALIVLALVLVGGGVVVAKFLTSSIDYYCNVDELGVKDGCESERRLRVQGTVEEGSVVHDEAGTSFRMMFGERSLTVRYDPGDPGGMFQECVPVVVHGRLDAASGVFIGDNIEVKHSNEYEAENAERIDDATSAACAQPSA